MDLLRGVLHCTASPWGIRNFLRDNSETRRGRFAELDKSLQEWGALCFFVSVHGNVSFHLFLA